MGEMHNSKPNEIMTTNSATKREREKEREREREREGEREGGRESVCMFASIVIVINSFPFCVSLFCFFFNPNFYDVRKSFDKGKMLETDCYKPH
jgi:hypothetical protein